MRLFNILVFFIVVISTCYAYIVEVQPKLQECFFEELERGERLIASYQVLAGGMLDINVNVLGPDSKTVFATEREQEGSFQFAAIRKGIYHICFANTMSTMTSKVVSFNIYTGSNLHAYQNAKGSHMRPLDRAIMSLTESVRQYVDTYHYLRGRLLTCMSTATSTNSRVFWWGMFNIVLLVVALYLRTALTKRPFERKNLGYRPL